MPVVKVLATFTAYRAVLATAKGVTKPLVPPILLQVVNLHRLVSVHVPIDILVVRVTSTPFTSTSYTVSTVSMAFKLDFAVDNFLRCFLATTMVTPASSRLIPGYAPPLLALKRRVLDSVVSASISLDFSTVTRWSSKILPTVFTVVAMFYFLDRNGSSLVGASAPKF